MIPVTVNTFTGHPREVNRTEYFTDLVLNTTILAYPGAYGAPFWFQRFDDDTKPLCLVGRSRSIPSPEVRMPHMS